MNSSTDKEGVDPVTQWLRSQDVAEPELSHVARMNMPGGALLLKTNSAEFLDYACKYGRHLLADPASRQAETVAEIIALDDPSLPALVPHGEADDGAFVGPEQTFRSFCKDRFICAWRFPSLMGCVSRGHDAGVRVAVTVANPQLCQTQDDGHRAKRRAVKGLPYNSALYLVWCLVARVRGLTIFHGAVVEKNGCGILLVGQSGAGKTTTALTLVRAGYRLLSDEFAVLWRAGAERGRFSGILVPAMIVGQPPASLDGLEETTKSANTCKQAYAVEPCLTSTEPVRIKSVIALTRPLERQPHHQASPMKPLDLVPLLMAQMLDPVCAERMDSIEALSDWAAGVVAHRVVAGSELATLPAFIEKLMAERAPCGVGGLKR